MISGYHTLFLLIKVASSPGPSPPRRGRGLGTRLLIKDALRVLGGRFQLPDGLAEALVLCFQNLLVLKRREMVYTAAY